MCYKACFYNGGHGRKKTDTGKYSNARIGTEKGRDQYENSRRKTRKDGKTEGKLANLQNLQHLHTHTRARTL